MNQFVRMTLVCPRCGFSKPIRVTTQVPVQRFDVKCCTPWEVDVSAITVLADNSTVWRITWQ